MKVAIYTLGCKVNQTESEYMAELLSKSGFEIVGVNEEADYYIVNSCTVTATADQKTRQNVRKFKRRHPNSVVILTGCMPQAFPKDAEKLIEADIVIGNRRSGDILDVINEYSVAKNRIIKISEHEKGDRFADCSITKFSERVRAFVKIEDGCNRFCSYCIIPMSRGRVRSKPLKDLENEVENLANNGIKEIVLVGINLSSYGLGENFNLVDAVKICAKNEKIKRVRLSSLEPDNITDEIIEELSKIEKLCPQFHISLQSGCDKTLKNMNRHYNSGEYRALCNKLRSSFTDATITTDVMVGFHEETEEDFYDCLNFVREIAFQKVHVFPYSEREGTAASRRGDSVPKAEKERRAHIMINETSKIRENYLKTLVGKKETVLFENVLNGCEYQGYTKNYTLVKANFNKNIIGEELPVIIDKAEGDFCHGTILLDSNI